MFRNDYIMRLIEQLGAVLASVLKLGDVGQFQQALAALDQAYHQFFGLDADLINAMDDDYLIEMLSPHGVLDGERALVMANLLLAEGDLYQKQGQIDEAALRHHKSLRLLLAAAAAGAGSRLGDHPAEVETVLATLANHVLPLRTLELLFAYYERSGAYGQAEDVLFQMLDGDRRERRDVRAGIAFYRRLLARSDEALEAGNLPRAEAEEGLNELRHPPYSEPWRSRRYRLAPLAGRGEDL